MKFWYISGLFFILFSVNTHANQTPSHEPSEIRLVTWSIPLFVESAETGLFIQMVNQIQKRSGKKIVITVQGRAKALVDFSNGKYHGVFPAHTWSLDNESVTSSSFYQRKDFIFHPKDKKIIRVKDLSKKKVGLTFRYTYLPEILNNRNIRIEYAEDDFANMKKLGEGKLDAFVVEEKSGLQALKQSGYTNIAYSANHPISSISIHFAFKKSEQGKRLQEIFDQNIAEMKKDGTIDRLFSFSLK